jgi:hypothetical protein
VGGSDVARVVGAGGAEAAAIREESGVKDTLEALLRGTKVFMEVSGPEAVWTE